MTLSHRFFSSQLLLVFFPITAPFPALSILTIPLDKCQMKSTENINILDEIILFCLKNFFFLKSFYFKEKYVSENKN